MRNLKKVLTLVLTLAMLLSVMVVGAGAAFSDQDSIKNDEAVDMCTTLNIIGGYEDGSFRPTGNVTRAEMSKMICVALNGGKEPTMGSNLIATFNDVASTDWSAPYIEYCVSQGIVGGVGGGNFNPNGNITGTQAAKMLLCILGYNASIQGYVGDDYWETNINVDAAQKGLYDKLANIDASAPLTRDQAAQMIWNALNAYEVEYITTLVTGPNGELTSKVTVQDKVVGNNKDKITLLEDKYNCSNDYGKVIGYEWSDSKDAYIYTLASNSSSDAKNSSGEWINGWSGVVSGGTTSTTDATKTFTYDGDCTEFFQMNVKVVYSRNTANNTTTVLGMVADDSKVLATGILDDIEYTDSGSIKIDSTKYNTNGNFTSAVAYAENSNTPVAPFKTASGRTNLDTTELSASYSFRAIDQDNDGKIDLITYLPVYPAKVTSVGTKQITVTYHTDFKTTDAGADIVARTLKFEDDTIYDGVAKDDYVLVTNKDNTAFDKNIVEKMSSVSGAATGTRDDKVQVDGTWYNNMTEVASGSRTEFRLDATYDYYNVGSFVFYADQKGSATLNDVLYVEAIDVNNLSTQAKVWFYDGTSTTVTLGDVYYLDDDNTFSPASAKDDLEYTVSGTTYKAVGNTFTYAVKNGEYELTLIGDDTTDANDLGYDWSAITSGDKLTAATDNIAGKLDGASISDDAVVFIQYVDSSKTKIKVVSGAVAKHYSSDITLTGGGKLCDTINGTDTVVMAYIATSGNLPNAKGVSGNYGYVVDKPFMSKIDGTKVAGYPIWDGKSVTTVYEESNSIAQISGVNVAKGDLITFDNLGDGMVDNVGVAENGSFSLVTAAVKGIENGNKAFTISDATPSTLTVGGSTVTLGDMTYIITDSTTVLYVDSDAIEGAETGSLQTAKDASVSAKEPNIKFVIDEADGNSAYKLDLLVIEVNNEWK